MKILIIGNGGREHALAWKAAQSKKVDHVFVAPGNGGTASESKVENIEIAATNVTQLIEFAKENSVSLTIVGPEAPLASGIVDAFQTENLACFGPTQAAAQLESSKEFAKDFMLRHNIPTAAYESFSDPSAAKAYVQKQNLPIVIKADGLAAGKGVIIAETLQQAEQTIDDMLAGNQFGEAGHRIVIEEFLTGEEASFIVVSDGENIVPLVSSQDHKARDTGDKGPNTGGMGAYSPAPVVTKTIEEITMETVIKPVIAGMKAEGMPFSGFLYAGLMIGPDNQIKVLEFNCRLGDPEAQVLLLRLQSDLIQLCKKTIERKLDSVALEWDTRPALGVVLAADGYPNAYEKGLEISGLKQTLNHCKIFHAGTIMKNDKTVTNGGRVLCACALAESIGMAQDLAYDQVKHIHWNGLFYRPDIGYKAINHQK